MCVCVCVCVCGCGCIHVVCGKTRREEIVHSVPPEPGQSVVLYDFECSDLTTLNKPEITYARKKSLEALEMTKHFPFLELGSKGPNPASWSGSSARVSRSMKAT